MKQVVQQASGGDVRVIDVPVPTIGPTEVLVRTVVSTVSAGTEAAMMSLAQSSLASKAKARPDLVRQVIAKAKQDGVAATTRAVRARLDDLIPLGYSAAGEAVEVGEAVRGIAPGDLVATGGAGRANHAEYQSVPGNLCVRIPDGVSVENASFSTIASIAMHGIRQAEATAGEFVAVIGAGLIGRLTLRLARASGLFAYAVDISDDAVRWCIEDGFEASVSSERTSSSVRSWSHGRGADAVIITAAGRDSSAVEQAMTLCRDRGRIVVVGDVQLDIDRRQFYEHELELRIARSYGPGRYERSFEEYGIDYPAQYIRWTEQRNMESVLDFMRLGRVTFDDLVTHTFPIEKAPDAYRMIRDRSEPYTAIQLTCSRQHARPNAPRARTESRAPAGTRLGVIGAGTFTRGVLLPALRAAGFSEVVKVASGSGLSAAHLAETASATKGAGTTDEVLSDPDVDCLVIATPHSSHAELIVAGLNAGKSVFTEKPLALTFDELDKIEGALETASGMLFAGFNRRWSAPIRRARTVIAATGSPSMINYRVNAGPVPDGHWYEDRREGGRLIGEICHFVDTCEYLAGQPAASVNALASAETETLLSESFIVSLRYPNGSLATISYGAGGHPQTPKERIEIMNGGHTIVVDDFRTLSIDGETTRLRGQDKGHRGEARSFFELVSTGDTSGCSGISAMRTTLLAAAALSAGSFGHPQRDAS